MNAEIDEEIEKRVEARTGHLTEQVEQERSALEERKCELDAREAILRKRYGSGQPRGRPAEYSEAQMYRVHDLHREGVTAAEIAREINLTPRQVRHIIKHKLPTLRQKSQQLRAFEFTSYYRAFQKELRAWAKVLPKHRLHELTAARDATRLQKDGMYLLTDPKFERGLPGWLASDHAADMPARLVLATDRLHRWMKHNKATWD